MGAALFSFADTLCSLSMGVSAASADSWRWGSAVWWARLEVLMPFRPGLVDHPVSWVVASIAYDSCYYLAHRAGIG